MSRIALTVLVCSLLAGCASQKPQITPVVIKEVKIKDLAPKPSGHMMEPPEKPKAIPKGASKGQSTPIMVQNNLIAKDNEQKVINLQATINNLFK